MNPFTMNWAESGFQKLLFFLSMSVLIVSGITLTPVFDEGDAKGKILTLTIQFFLIYIVTIWFSKLFVTAGRRVR